MTPRHLILATAAALLATGLGACSRSGTEPAPADNQATEAPETLDTPTPVASATPDEPSVTPASAAPETGDVNTAAEAPQEAAPPPDAQMMDDASATGMTSRTSRGEQSSNDTAADRPNE